MGRNVVWLLGGRGFAGLVSIGYLAIASRALGPSGFGGFALILAYAGSIANFTQFNSWQAVIRFGSLHVARRRPDALARLLGFTISLDALGALVGIALATLGAGIAARLLHWSATEESRAVLFAGILQLSAGGTATGLLRLIDRFDLQTYAEAVGPAVRLMGGLLAWQVEAGLDGFLIVWALAALLEGAAAWFGVVHARTQRPRFGLTAFWSAAHENPGLWLFMLQSNVSSSIGLLWEQIGTLAVGMQAGPAAAGAFRVASKLAGALAKPIESVTRVLYPELARLVAAEHHATLRRIVGRITVASALLGLILIGAIWLYGPILLRVFSGRRFAFAQLYLFPLTIAAAIDLWGTALEPLHTAYGQAGRVLAIRCVGAAVYAVALAATICRLGPVAAALALITAAATIRGLLAISAMRLLAGAGPTRRSSPKASRCPPRAG